MTKRNIMISNVSWGLYFSALGPILFLYYAVIMLLFFRKEIQSLFEPKTSGTSGTAIANLKVHSNASEGSVIEGMETVVKDLRAILEQAGPAADKDQLLARINTRLSGYSGLRHPVFQPAITKYLINNAMGICGVSFSEQELLQGWESLPQ